MWNASGPTPRSSCFHVTGAAIAKAGRSRGRVGTDRDGPRPIRNLPESGVTGLWRSSRSLFEPLIAVSVTFGFPFALRIDLSREAD
jgi:hypothetical protein